MPANWATESMSGPRMRKLWFHEKRVNLLWLMTLSPIGRAKSARQSHLFGEKNRAGGIRTRDLLNPIQGYEMLQRTRMERHVAAQFGMECPRSNIHRALRAIELRQGAARCGTEFFAGIHSGIHNLRPLFAGDRSPPNAGGHRKFRLRRYGRRSLHAGFPTRWQAAESRERAKTAFLRPLTSSFLRRRLSSPP